MAITYTPVSPEDGDTNISLKAELVVNLADSGGITISTIDIDVTQGIVLTRAINNGVFVNGFSGEIIDTNGDQTALTIVIIRPTSDPSWKQGRLILVNINSSAFTYSFTTRNYGYSTPPAYTESLTLTSLPSGYTPQAGAGGAPPVYSASGMTTVPGAGSSYIRKPSYGLDFDTGVLIDMEVYGTSGLALVLMVNSTDQGQLFVGVDFTNGEIFIRDVVNTPSPGFRACIKNDQVGEIGVAFRLSVKGAGQNLIARLFTTTAGSFDLPLLAQTGGPTIDSSAIDNSVNLGTINAGGAVVRVAKCNILNLQDPDDFYPFPQIQSYVPTSDSLDGGNTLRIKLEQEIDIALGSDLLFTEDTVSSESTGAGSINVFVGDLTLSLAGVGVASARFIHSFSGDLPSAADISFDVVVDGSLIANPPQSDVILAGAELSANGDKLNLEYVTNSNNGTFFRIRHLSGGVEIIRQTVFNSVKSSFKMRFVHVGERIVVFVDGTQAADHKFKDGIGILRVYASTPLNLSYDTVINNFQVKPVITIGDNVADL